MNHHVKQMLTFDPLDTAEKLMGGPSDAAALLGVAMHIEHTQAKNNMLLSMGDTTLNSSLESYLTIVDSLGFQQVLCLPFDGWGLDGKTHAQETLRVLAHRDGMLLCLDTWQSHQVNSAKVYYNWQPYVDSDQAWGVTSSGHWLHGQGNAPSYPVWVGDHDAREAIRHKIQGLRDNGLLLPIWLERPFLWLLHYMDTKVEGYNYHAINTHRIQMLPEWVRRMITPEAE